MCMACPGLRVRVRGVSTYGRRPGCPNAFLVAASASLGHCGTDSEMPAHRTYSRLIKEQFLRLGFNVARRDATERTDF